MRNYYKTLLKNDKIRGKRDYFLQWIPPKNMSHETTRKSIMIFSHVVKIIHEKLLVFFLF